MDRRASTDRRDLYNGFGDTMARAFEVVFTPLLFGVFGWWLDGRTHTRPLFALVFGVFTAVYTLWKLSKGYMTRMEAEERKVVPRDH